jgi:protein-S-isoprenylcysteine O-methyltransferase Ste14
MSVITEERPTNNSAGIPHDKRDKGGPDKSPVERHRRWLHGFFWPAFCLTVVMTKPSIDNAVIHKLIGIVGYALVTAAAVGRLWCSLYIRGRKSKELCQEGPYSICRNPLYVSAFLGGMGIAVVSNRAALMIVFPALFAAYYLLVIKAEEKRLTALYGEEYEAYRAVVPRIIPRFGIYRTPMTVAVTPEHYLRGIVKSMGYFWIVFALQLVESMKYASH